MQSKSPPYEGNCSLTPFHQSPGLLVISRPSLSLIMWVKSPMDSKQTLIIKVSFGELWSSKFSFCQGEGWKELPTSHTALLGDNGQSPYPGRGVLYALNACSRLELYSPFPKLSECRCVFSHVFPLFFKTLSVTLRYFHSTGWVCYAEDFFHLLML